MSIPVTDLVNQTINKKEILTPPAVVRSGQFRNQKMNLSYNLNENKNKDPFTL